MNFDYISAVRVPYLDLKAIHDPLEEELHRCFFEVMDESYFVYGRQVSEFEKAFAEKLGIQFCLATANCTDSLFIVLKMLGIGKGDEVIVPAMTWITDAEVVSNLGAIPVFVDVHPESHTLDPAKIEVKLTERTKAIIPVHLYGQMADMSGIMKIAKAHQLKVVEDCAQSHFATFNGKSAGTIGDAAVFSFYPTKNLGALGDAGAIITNDKLLYEGCRKLANHGALDKHSHEFPGINSRMDTLQAAILCLKLQYIDQWNAERNHLAKRYNEALKSIHEIVTPLLLKGNEHVYHVYQILTKRRDDLRKHLKDQGIQTQVHYPKAVPFTQAYSGLGYEPSDFPIAYQIQEEGLSLPIYPGMEDEQQEYVIKQIKQYYN